MPVALVNSDRGATVDGKQIDAGGEITRKLHDSKTFDWREVSAEEAAEGLENGTYYLSLTMPADFSAKIASSSGEDPATGALQVRTNDANNYIVGSISRTVFSEVRSAASTNASRGFLDKIFVNFSDLHDKTAEAADGADKLTDGAGKAQKGAKDLANGLDTAKEKNGELTGGLKKLNEAAGQLETGTKDVAAAPRRSPTRSAASPTRPVPSSRTPRASRPAPNSSPTPPRSSTSTSKPSRRRPRPPPPSPSASPPAPPRSTRRPAPPAPSRSPKPARS